MAAPAPPRIVIDGDDGSSLAVATIDIIDLDVVRASLHVNPGHLPPGTRARRARIRQPCSRKYQQARVSAPRPRFSAASRFISTARALGRRPAFSGH